MSKAKQEKDTKLVWHPFPAWGYEKMENWLNTMALEGWALAEVNLFGFYTFYRTEPDAYIVRMEMGNVKDQDYIDFMQEECEAEYLGHTGDWMFFKRKSEKGDFRLLPRLDDRIAHLTKVAHSQIFFAVWMLLRLLRGIERPENIAWWIQCLNLAVMLFMVYGLGRVHGKREELEKERQLHE